jgi:hypothetical protein
LSRYKGWLETNLDPTLKSHGSEKVRPSHPPSPPFRSPHPTQPTAAPPSEALSPEQTAADEMTLRVLAATIVDNKMLDGKVRGLWGEVVEGMLGEVEGGEEVSVGAEGADLLLTYFLMLKCLYIIQPP